MRARWRDPVRSPTAYPIFKSSPWILGAPKVGFSWAICRMRRRISARVVGQLARDFPRQTRRKARRYKAITVSGLTRTKACFQPLQYGGEGPESPASV